MGDVSVAWKDPTRVVGVGEDLAEVGWSLEVDSGFFC
jgi:hypothetical protein